MPVMQPHQFKATPEEIELAECIQRTTAGKPTAGFGVDGARRILKESGLPHGQIRDICTIADLDGDGNLSHQELCAVVRLAGWAQKQGVKMSEGLLARVGPLPELKGVPYAPRNAGERIYEHDAPYHSHNARDIQAPGIEISEPQQAGAYNLDQTRVWHQPGPQLVYPPITMTHMETCRRLFERAGPMSGLMDKETAEDVLMRHLHAPFLLLKPILNLVRTSNRLSLNILEFTLAAYFVEGLQSRTIRTLPSEVPKGLYDQLWTPMLLSAPPMNAATRSDERTLNGVVSTEQSPATSAQSSTSDLGLTDAQRLSPVRKEPRSSYPGPCPSVSSVETKKITKLWKRVAKHCKIEKVLKVSSTRYQKGKRESVLSSDVSVNGTVHTDSSGSSFEALERDSFLQPTRGQRVSMEISRLPLIYPSETGYYPSSDPVTVEVRHSLGGDVYPLDHIVTRSSVDTEEPSQYYLSGMDTTSVMSDLSVEESVRCEAGVGKMEVREESEAATEVSAMLKDIREEFTFFRLQMQTMQKTIQNLHLNGQSKTKNVHFANDVETDLGGRARDSTQMGSGTSRRTQSLKISKELAGPRDMLSIRSGSSSSSDAYHHSHRRHRWREEFELVQGPRVRDRHRESSSLSSISSLDSSESEYDCANIPMAPDYRRLPEVPTGRTDTTQPLRSILKTPADRPQTGQIRIIDHNGRPSNENNSLLPEPKQRKRATKRSGMTEETLQAWNARFIPSTAVPEQLRKLPRTPRKLPTPATAPIAPKRGRPRHLPPLPAASSSKFPGALTDEECSASSPNGSTVSSYFDMASVRRDTETETETAPSSAASTPRSSADFSSIFSHRHNSARTTLLTEIDEYNETVVRDLSEAAPELVLQVKRCLLRELRTKSDGMYDGVEDPPQSPMVKELEEALALLRAKEEELKRLEDTHYEVLRQQARELTKLEQEKQQLEWTLVDQEELIYNLRGPTAVADLSVELPEYTPRW